MPPWSAESTTEENTDVDRHRRDHLGLALGHARPVKDLIRFFARPGDSAGGGPPGAGAADAAAFGGSGDKPPRTYGTSQKVGMVLGPVLFLLTLIVFSPEGLSSEGKAVLASTLWVATWWVSEAIPIPVTSLLPIVLFPITGGLPVADTTHLLYVGRGVRSRWARHQRWCQPLREKRTRTVWFSCSEKDTTSTGSSNHPSPVRWVPSTIAEHM